MQYKAQEKCKQIRKLSKQNAYNFKKALALRTGSGYYRAVNKVSNGKDRPG